jgi:hypothetical protein
LLPLVRRAHELSKLVLDNKDAIFQLRDLLRAILGGPEIPDISGDFPPQPPA